MHLTWMPEKKGQMQNSGSLKVKGKHGMVPGPGVSGCDLEKALL